MIQLFKFQCLKDKTSRYSQDYCTLIFTFKMSAKNMSVTKPLNGPLETLYLYYLGGNVLVIGRNTPWWVPILKFETIIDA